MASNSTAKSRRAKPKHPKPYESFPLFPHQNGLWAKKRSGKLYYFGSIAADPEGEAALKEWLRVRDYPPGEAPPKDDTRLTVGRMCDRWLIAQKQRYDQGEITYRAYVDYKTTTDRLVRVFGSGRRVGDLRPDDFARLRDDIASTYSLASHGKAITTSRSVFKYAVESRWIDVPVIFGPAFKAPSRKVLKRQRAAAPPKMFEAAEIRTMLKKADSQMKAFILLGINCGFGPADIGRLTTDAIDFKGGWIDHARGKTGEPRRCPMWKRTATAIKAALKIRREPKRDTPANLVFLTAAGLPWHKEQSSSTPLSAEFRKFMRDDVKAYREGCGFYALRHTFETIAGDSRDQVAVNAVMGHVDASMGAIYRERIEDDRFRAVAAHVERWLFPAKKRRAAK